MHCCSNWQQVLTVTLFPCQNIIDLIFMWCCFGGSYHESFFNFYFINKTSLGILEFQFLTPFIDDFNLTKITFNYYQFKVSPFTIEMLYSVILATLAISLAIVLPNFSNNFWIWYTNQLWYSLFSLWGITFMRIYPLDKF